MQANASAIVLPIRKLEVEKRRGQQLSSVFGDQNTGSKNANTSIMPSVVN
jgi:hypothetical protein